MTRQAALTAMLVLLLALGGCGEDPGPDAGPSTTPSAAVPSSATGGEQVAILTETAVGGVVTSAATPLPDAAAVQAYAAQFSRPALGEQIARTVEATSVPAGQALWAAVVAIGCEAPRSVQVVVAGGGVTVAPVQQASAGQQCLAPMTSVALVLAPAPS